MKLLIPVLILAVFAAAGPSFGDDGSITMLSISAVSGVQVYAGTPSVINNNNDKTFEGPYQYTFANDGTGLAANLDGETLSGFCINLSSSIAHSGGGSVNASFTLEALSADPAVQHTYNQIQSLMAYASAGLSVNNGSGTTYSGDVNLASPTSSPASGGLGIAIWAVLQETNSSGLTPGGVLTSATSGFGYSISPLSTFNGGFDASTPGGVGFKYSGSGTYTGVEIDYAKALLNELNASNSNSNSLGTSNQDVYALVNPGGLQPQALLLTGEEFGIPPPTPEPSVFVGLTGLALCCAPAVGRAFLRRRRGLNPTKLTKQFSGGFNAFGNDDLPRPPGLDPS